MSHKLELNRNIVYWQDISQWRSTFNLEHEHESHDIMLSRKSLMGNIRVMFTRTEVTLIKRMKVEEVLGFFLHKFKKRTQKENVS